jgi:hypothetical protein
VTWPSLVSAAGFVGGGGWGRGEGGRGRGRSRVDEGAVSMKEATTSPAAGAVSASARSAEALTAPACPAQQVLWLHPGTNPS